MVRVKAHSIGEAAARLDPADIRGLQRLMEAKRQLQDLAMDTDSMCKMAVYEGARVVADAVREGIKTIPDQTRPPKKEDGYVYKGLYPDQKKGLEEGLGVSPITKEGGVWSARVGFEGYNERKTRQYPKGQPNQPARRRPCCSASIPRPAR